VLVHLKDGMVEKIAGDPDHPMNRGFICVKGRAQPQVLYHPDRLKAPMKRFGESESSRWQRISWDRALDEIAARLTELKEKHDPGRRGRDVNGANQPHSFLCRLN
jgi:anaerobic selenocysteine-containing dehydrogenase